LLSDIEEMISTQLSEIGSLNTFLTNTPPSEARDSTVRRIALLNERLRTAVRDLRAATTT
jgi:hypothetical protein